MARFIELEDIKGCKVSINIDFIQTNLEYSKVIELIKPKKKGFRLWQ